MFTTAQLSQDVAFARIYSDRKDVIDLLVQECDAEVRKDKGEWWEIRLHGEHQKNFHSVLREHKLYKGTWVPF